MKIRLKNIHFPATRASLATLPDGKLLINTINAHSYNTARNDAAFAEALLKGDVLIPDGASIVKAVKWLAPQTAKVGVEIERIAGWDLFDFEMKRLAAVEMRHASSLKKSTVFFLGSSDEVLSKIRAKASLDYPNLEIHTYSPPFKPEFTAEENRNMIAAVNAVQPDILWIGMTAPKQEKWAYTHFNALNVKGHIGTIGAVFDFYAGTAERAPIWWQEHSLEWLYRLIKEPRRMWKRYLIGNVKFIMYIIAEKFGK